MHEPAPRRRTLALLASGASTLALVVRSGVDAARKRGKRRPDAWIAYGDRLRGAERAGGAVFTLRVPAGKVHHLDKGRAVMLSKALPDAAPRSLGRVTLSSPAVRWLNGPGTAGPSPSYAVTRICDAAEGRLRDDEIEVRCPRGWRTVSLANPGAPGLAAASDPDGRDAPADRSASAASDLCVGFSSDPAGLPINGLCGRIWTSATCASIGGNYLGVLDCGQCCIPVGDSYGSGTTFYANGIHVGDSYG